MPRRKLYPMPVEGLVDHPELLAMPAAGAGIVFRLALHFWQTECRPLPTADHELRAIGRVHTPTWRHWKASALRVFEDIRPELEAYWLRRSTKADTLRIAAHTAAVGRRARKKRTQLEASALATGAAPVEASALPRVEAARAERPVRAKAAKARTLTDRAA